MDVFPFSFNKNSAMVCFLMFIPSSNYRFIWLGPQLHVMDIETHTIMLIGYGGIVLNMLLKLIAIFIMRNLEFYLVFVTKMQNREVNPGGNVSLFNIYRN